MGMKPGADGSLAPVPGYLTEEVKRTPELLRPENDGELGSMPGGKKRFRIAKKTKI